jgi:hypothetical protein
MNLKIAHKNLSSYAGIMVWGASGFMAYPSISSGIYHLTVLPLAILGTIWLAHQEGRRS